MHFANRFLGYGSLKSDVWLVGPEAGGGETIEKVYERATVWAESGQKETEDLHGYHADLKLSPRADWTKNIQPTWGPLIRVILAFNEKRADTEDVRDFQKCELGRADGENCVLDLSPLPSPSKSHRILDGFGYSWLGTGQEREARLTRPRCDLLRRKLIDISQSLFSSMALQRNPGGNKSRDLDSLNRNGINFGWHPLKIRFSA